jgi:hypothetical protein
MKTPDAGARFRLFLLRHSREVTQVCSPKVTHRTGEKAAYRLKCVAGMMHGLAAAPGREKQGTCTPSARMKSLG